MKQEVLRHPTGEGHDSPCYLLSHSLTAPGLTGQVTALVSLSCRPKAGWGQDRPTNLSLLLVRPSLVSLARCFLAHTSYTTSTSRP